MLNIFILASAISGATEVNSSPSAQQFTKWASVKEVYQGPIEPIGSYDAGCLSGAEKLDKDGPGYAIMRLKRHRFFAHPAMKDYLRALGQRLRSMKMPLLLVGDVSGPRGGPMPIGHNSHQTGLDADLWLRMSQKRPSRGQRESWGAPSFVRARKKLKKNWSATQVRLISAAADMDSVNRIFVSPPIKKYFCEHLADKKWLYKVRPWWGHEEHIHVRLSCPSENSSCISQSALNPEDNGCGADLAWWFSEEADEKWAKIAADHTPREFPELPAACEKMVR